MINQAELFLKLLDFLDRSKLKNNNTLLGTVLPIPPTVWNSAIDVIKNVLRATNSAQKAIRVAGKYIVVRGYSVAQAEDFKQSMTDKLANTKTGQTAIIPDDEESSSEANLVKAATELQSRIKATSPDETMFAALPVNNMTKKELHRYIEIASVMAVDRDGILSDDMNSLSAYVAERLNHEPGATRNSGAYEPLLIRCQLGLLDDEDNIQEVHSNIKHKDDMPEESMPGLKPQTDTGATSDGKEHPEHKNAFKNRHVWNLEQLKQFRPSFERVFLRLVLIGILMSLVVGYSVYEYYSIAKFAMLLGFTLLFWLECKKHFYWTMLITGFGICLYNPIEKPHFNRQTWILFDQRLIWLLIGCILIEIIIVVVNLKKRKYKQPEA